MSSCKKRAVDVLDEPDAAKGDSNTETKKPRLEPEPEPSAASSSSSVSPALHYRGLLDLDDPSLLRLLSLLPLQDRLRVADACSRLRRLCSDTSLWTDVDTLSGPPLTLRDLRKLLNFLHDRTHRIAIRGFLRAGGTWQREAVSASILAHFESKCPNLETLALSECFVDASKVRLDMFPKSISRLLLPSTEFVNTPVQHSYFKDMETSLPNLVKIDLSGCGWVSNHSLMAICKCEKLEELSLRGCFRIGVCFVYTALACRFGFKQLRKLDLRDTSIGNSEVPTFGSLPELTHLYMGKTSASLEILRPSNCESDGEITDRGLLSLCRSSGDRNTSKIEHLTLTHQPRVTNRSMTRLATSLPLRSLDVRGTKVSEVGVTALKGLRPSCKVQNDPLPLSEGEEEAPADVDNRDEEVVVLQLQQNGAGEGVVVVQQAPI